MPRTRVMNGPQLVVGILGKSNTHVFRRLARGNVPTRVEAFPALLLSAQHAPSPVDWVPVASLCQIAHTVVQHGSVFTAGPSPANPYTFQLFKVLWVYSHRGAKKWKCIRAWLKPRTPNYGGRDPVACGGLKPFSVKMRMFVCAWQPLQSTLLFSFSSCSFVSAS
jgi:hypothetical protein